jgi:ABC-type uncharacterized transport system substrate-binding protein
MTNLQQVLARLNSDETFRRSVQRQGALALQEYNLSVNEIAALSGLDLSQWTEIAANGPVGPNDNGGSIRGIRV